MRNTILTIIVTAAITLLTTLGGIFLTSVLNNNQSNKEKKQIIISELEGLSVWRRQLYVSRMQAETQSDFYEFRYYRLRNKIDESEFIRLAHEAERLTLEVAKVNQTFLEKIGYVSVLFKKSEDLELLIEENRKFVNPKINLRPNREWTLEQLEKWNTEITIEMTKFIEEEYGKKPEKLIEKLKTLVR